MSDLSELYQEIILDHNKKPRNFGKLAEANRTAEGYNPLCGDRITVYLLLEKEMIRNITFEGIGCAISKASASLMTSAIKGKTVAEAESLFQKFHTLVTSDVTTNADPAELGKLAVFAGVREFPARVKCASLAWHTMRGALAGKQDPVTTEKTKDSRSP